MFMIRIIIIMDNGCRFDLETVLSYVKFEDVIPNFEGHRVRIVYDSSLVKDLLVLQHIVPYFSERLPTYLRLYSEALYYKFVKRVSLLLKVKPELERAIDSLRIVKIGRKEETRYGKLMWFVEQGDLEEEFESLLMFLMKLKDELALILYGSVEYYLTGIGGGFKKIVDMFSVLPEDITLFGFRHRHNMSSPEAMLIGELYDITVRVWKDDQSFDNTTFCFTVECQCSGNVKHGKLKLVDGLLASII